ncbi:MAG: lysozyme inhibitor LprI family protein [Pyrinomonadaceae bacterium]
MKKLFVSLIFITCFLDVLVLPQKKEAEKSPCIGNETQAGANACARYKHEQADAAMNRVYRQLMSELAGFDGKDQEKLKQAQMLWLQYRDSNCESEASVYEGGSIRPAIYNHCLASMTQERTRRMKAFLTEVKM